MASERTETDNLLNIKTSDGEIFTVKEKVASFSQLLKYNMEDFPGQDVLLSNVNSKTMKKVLQWCEEHASAGNADLKKWDADYIDLDQAVLYDVLMAANYLEINDLLSLCCQRVADMIRGKSTEEIRETFNIQSDLTKEEEERYRKENSWAFQR